MCSVVGLSRKSDNFELLFGKDEKRGKKVLTKGGRGGILTKLSARAGGRDTDERKKLRIR